MAVNLGMDFGARIIKIYQKGRGIVLREPNVAAVDADGYVIAVGTDALMVRARAPGTVTIRRPIENGSIEDFNLCAELLDRFLEKVAPKTRKNVLVGVKYGFGSRNRELLYGALKDCRTGKITFVDSAVAALRGCGIYTDHDSEYGGTLVCDVGASFVEVAYLRSGELLRAENNTWGGDFADREICAYIHRNYGLSVISSVARDIKHGLNLSGNSETVITLTGTDTTTGMPKKIEVTVQELIMPCKPHIDGVGALIKTALGNLPVHGTNESNVEKIVLVGGCAEMDGFGEYVANAIGCEIIMPESVSDCVISGIGEMLEERDGV